MWVTLITKKKCGLHLKNAFFKLVVNNLLFGIGVLHSYVVLCSICQGMGISFGLCCVLFTFFMVKKNSGKYFTHLPTLKELNLNN